MGGKPPRRVSERFGDEPDTWPAPHSKTTIEPRYSVTASLSSRPHPSPHLMMMDLGEIGESGREKKCM